MIKSIERYTKHLNHFSRSMNNSFQMPMQKNTVSNHQNHTNVVQNIKSGFKRCDSKIKANDNK